MTELSLALSSCITNVVQVEQYAESLQKHYRISLDKFPDILISLTEAVNNAIIHGNNQDLEKQVLIQSQKTQKGLVIMVSDEGTGFNPKNLPDPTCQENICECGGRGVFLMKELCDKISFDNNGSTVKLFFAI
ncbi:MAG: ATP-binding protein [Saprospiraceae bacterium]|nr:ATP-binding protein [Saprospiraceae bacterium]